MHFEREREFTGLRRLAKALCQGRHLRKYCVAKACLRMPILSCGWAERRLLSGHNINGR